jgi:hypothetical protein
MAQPAILKKGKKINRYLPAPIIIMQPESWTKPVKIVLI